VTAGYPGVDITSWGQSFSDGKAFAAVLNKFAPEKLDYGKASKEKPAKLLDKAFDVASEDPFGVPKLLDASDLVGGAADTKSLITYVAKLRQACLNINDGRAAALEAERLAKLAEQRAKEHAATMEELDKLGMDAEELKRWCKEKEDDFRKKIASGELDKGLSVDDLQNKLKELKAFKSLEKPPKASEKQELMEKHAALEAKMLEQQANGTTVRRPPQPAARERARAVLETRTRARVMRAGERTCARRRAARDADARRVRIVRVTVRRVVCSRRKRSTR
jgi:actinin alpha